jgi:hypothetical protein
LVLIGRSRQKLERMDRAGEFFGQNRVNLPLTGDTALTGEARGHDFEAKMGLFAALRTSMVAGVEMRIVINVQTLGLQRGLEFPANAI